ncbi:tRNA modification GTPase trmE [Ruminococcaceae bacterium KH2T8]|nr:tRNA modification GTPase trmE [Ruminococcaceae bacterium KH2T8]
MIPSELDSRPFCACSTPSGTAGIAVIRLSGTDSAAIADKCVRIIRASSDSIKSCLDMPGYTAAYAEFRDPSTDTVLDNVIITRFVAPYSYTGDEMIEISCHGGNAVKQEILRVLEGLGARQAERGEFTKRAFINGKLDMAEAEAVMNVIEADSRRTLDAANSQMHGELSSRLSKYEEVLYKALALIEMIVEFPEHDDTPENTDEVMSLCREALEGIENLIRSYAKGKILTERMKIVLCGLPNSGKSTLLNSIAGFERAIVTEVPGTTRDTIELQTVINSIPVTIVDTAGIRETEDAIEEMGVKRAVRAVSEADLIFYLISPDTTAQVALETAKDLIPAKTRIVFTKTDSGINPEKEAITDGLRKIGIGSFTEISAKDGINLSSIEDAVTEVYENAGGLMSDNITILSSRHCDCLEAASDKLRSAMDAIEGGLGVDIASSVIRAALDDIGSVTGKTVSVELADTIFSKFCIGK